MNCESCGRTNRPEARFCRGCGKPLVPRCPACGAESEPNSQFCDVCGAPLVVSAGAGTDDAAARKIVTIVFADLVGSTSLHERLDAESVRRFMDRYYDAMRGAVEGHGGTVTQLLGDGVKAVFGAPRVAEDDALRAVRAAVEMQCAFRALADEQRGAVGKTGLRVAVNTGEVVASEKSEIIGDPVNVAARLQEQARDGDVVIGESTRRLVSELVTLMPLGAFSLKGRAETVAAYRVVSLERPAGVPAIGFVGRDDELVRVHAVYDAVVSERRARLVVLLGSPGLGKSRLVGEFVRRLGDEATVLTAQCDAAGGATFAPIGAALRALLRIDEGAGSDAMRATIEGVLPGDDAERGRIAAGVTAVLTGAPASPEETFFVLRRLLVALAAVQPVVLAIDDLQWAEPLLLDLVEHLVQWGAGAPLLVLGAARPELRDTRSSLTTSGGYVHDVVTLGGLDAAAATRLAANVIGAEALPAAVAGRVLATSEGNPLFVGELVRMLVQDGALKRDGDRWTAAVELAALEMPPTIHALLAARIERLRPEDRTVLERAAVVGRQFSRAALGQLLPPDGRVDLDGRLESLRRSELIESDPGWFLGDPALRFHHVLIRDAAYRGVLKGTRADLHGRVADWIEAKASGAAEHDEMIGWHLEQAHEHLRELGPIDERGRVLGERASRYLAAVGRRALARDDVPVAASLLGRAIDRLDPGDAARADLALDWCEALLAAGDVGRAAGAIEELGRVMGDSPRLRAWHTCFGGQLAVLTEPQALRVTTDAVAAAAETLASLTDAAGEAKAHSVHALALARLGAIGACEAALDRALAAARRAHDRRRANAVLAGAPLAALWGPSPVTRASGRCLDVVRVLRITQGAPAVEAVALRCQAVLEALRGRTEAARRMIASSRRLVEELGITHRLLEADVFTGFIELLEGNAGAAETSLRGAYDGLKALGLGIDAAQAAALLGRALLAQGRAAEAETLSEESEVLAGDDLQAAIAWRGVRAEALARRGEHASAVEFARAAVALAAATDALLFHADARIALAAALRAAGRYEEAGAEEARAIELWDAKGATLLAERARGATTRERVAAVEEPTAPARSSAAQAGAASSPRLRPNAATATNDGVQVAIASQDEDALLHLFSEHMQFVHHPTGTVWDREGRLATFRGMWRRVHELAYGTESLATLGDSLALARMSVTGSSLVGNRFNVGPYEIEEFFVAEVDGQGRQVLSEIFARDRLSDATARLYERYAEIQPGGPGRTRAATTARSVAMLLQARVGEDCAAALAPDVEFIDHRPVGFPSTRGAEAFLERFRARSEVASDIVEHDHAILGLEENALLMRRTTVGTAREGGGSFERPVIFLWIFGPDGLLTRDEWFDISREDDALARFDELTAGSPPARSASSPTRASGRSARRVVENAATASIGALNAAFAIRDEQAVAAVFADGFTAVQHSTGASWDKAVSIASIRSVWRAADAIYRNEPLATLGDSLALAKFSISATGVVGRRVDVGAYENAEVYTLEVDRQGRQLQTEVFPLDRLGEAVTRLYRRYAELVPEGPASSRAEATARSIASALGPRDPEQLSQAFAPDIEFRDLRAVVSWGSSRGKESIVRGLHIAFAAVRDVRFRVDDVLASRPDALVFQSTVSGTDRTSGGAYERQHLQLLTFGTDGLVTRVVWFDVAGADQALAQFDALAVEGDDTHPRPGVETRDAAATPPRFANMAMRTVDRFDQAWAARDWEGLTALYAPSYRCSDRRSMARIELDREQFLETNRAAFELAVSKHHRELLATRGERLVLFRVVYRGSGGDIGALETEWLSINEVDERGVFVASVMLDPAALDAAYDELDRRYVAGEGRPHATAIANMGVFRKASAERDWETVARLLPADFTLMSHRRLVGTVTPMDRAGYLASRGAVDNLGVRGDLRLDHQLRLSARAGVSVMTWYGTLDGGDFEDTFIIVYAHDGNFAHSVEIFDVDQLDRALARYEELAAAAPAGTPRITNAAARAIHRMDEAWAAHDWARVAADFAPDFRMYDRRSLVRLELDLEQHLRSLRRTFKMTSSRFSSDVVATRGDRLALARWRFEGIGRSDMGPSEIEGLMLEEVNERGERTALVMFDPVNFDAAYAELDDLYDRGEGAAYGHATMTRTFRRALADRDWETLKALLAPDLTVDDHRLLGWETLHGREPYIRALQSLVDLAPDVRLRLDHIITMSARAVLYAPAWVGTRDGGAFEEPSLIVAELDGSRRIRRFDQYNLDQLDEARARFEAIRSGSQHDPLTGLAKPNAATAAVGRVQAAYETRDWPAIRAACAPQAVIEDRRRHVSGDVEWWIADLKAEVHFSRQLVSVAGARVDVERIRWTDARHPEGPFEVEVLWVTEVDEAGRIVSVVIFDADDWRAANREASIRFFAIDPEGAAVVRPMWEFIEGFSDHDRPRMRAALADDLVVDDRRRAGQGVVHGAEAYLETVVVLWELARDIQFNIAPGMLVVEPHGWVGAGRGVGTFPEGGAFDNYMVHLSIVVGGRITRLELFELEDLSLALARLAELRPEAQRTAAVASTGTVTRS